MVDVRRRGRDRTRRSGLNLKLGQQVKFVDHPGLPITESSAVVVGRDRRRPSRRKPSRDARLPHVDRTLLDLDSDAPVFRGFAVASTWRRAARRVPAAAGSSGYWTWGFAAASLVAAPGLTAMSIQLRPDVLLSALCLVFAFAHRPRGGAPIPAVLAAAAFEAGLADDGQAACARRAAPAVVAAIWRPPAEGELPAALGRAWTFVREHRAAVGSIAGLWIALAVALNWDRFPFQPWLVTARRDALRARRRGRGRRACEGGTYFHVYAVLVVSFIGGLFIPVTLDLQEGTRALLYIVRNMSGRGVQEGIDPFSTPLSALDGIVGTPIVFVFLLALVAGIVGVVRREPVPVVWAVAALATGVFAYARPPNVHYFAPAFIFSALALLWLLQREPRARMPLLAWVIVLYVVWPAWDNRLNSTAEQERFAATVASAKSYVDAQLAPNEIALVPSYWPFADSRYFELVQIYVAHSPDYPYRYLPATAAVRSYEQPRQMRPRFYIGPLAWDLTAGKEVELGDLGRYTIVPREGLVAEIVAGPGVTEPW